MPTDVIFCRNTILSQIPNTPLINQFQRAQSSHPTTLLGVSQREHQVPPELSLQCQLLARAFQCCHHNSHQEMSARTVIRAAHITLLMHTTLLRTTPATHDTAVWMTVSVCHATRAHWAHVVRTTVLPPLLQQHQTATVPYSLCAKQWLKIRILAGNSIRHHVMTLQQTTIATVLRLQFHTACFLHSCNYL